MQYTKLGKTGLEVSRLCFGGLIIGPLQANLSAAAGAEIILKAFEAGVNFIDTAELYGTYPHIKKAMKAWGKKVVVSTKSYAYSEDGARESLEKARRELDMDVIDIFMLHEQETRLTLRGHRPALEYYMNAKEKGLIRAVGVSTHNVEVVEAACDMPEIEVIHPIINKAGLGIGDGNITQMLAAAEKANSRGKGIFGMKPLGGGNLANSYDECLKFVLELPFVHSIALGMQSADEVEMNVRVFEGKPVPAELRERLAGRKRSLHIDYWCEGCGRCAQRCKLKALSIIDGKASVDKEKCVLCGYCSSACPQFAIKVC